MSNKPTLREEAELAFIEYGLQFQQAEFLARVAANPLFHAIQREQDRQVAKWGVVDHPSFSFHPGWERTERVAAAEDFKKSNAEAATEGRLTWEDIMAEEFAESLAETTSTEALKTELIQMAAVALSWVESIERQAAAEASQGKITDTNEDQQDEDE